MNEKALRILEYNKIIEQLTELAGSELAKDRCQVLYGLDKRSNLRFSHENPSVQKCYQDYLGAPLSHRAHELLHTDHHAWSMPGETGE